MGQSESGGVSVSGVTVKKLMISVSSFSFPVPIGK